MGEYSISDQMVFLNYISSRNLLEARFKLVLEVFQKMQNSILLLCKKNRTKVLHYQLKWFDCTRTYVKFGARLRVAFVQKSAFINYADVALQRLVLVNEGNHFYWFRSKPKKKPITSTTAQYSQTVHYVAQLV